MIHHPWSTYPSQHQCGHSICIFQFYNIKTYMYYVLKIYSIIKRSTGGLWHYLGPTMFREYFRPPMMCLTWNENSQIYYHFIRVVDFIFDLCIVNLILLNFAQEYTCYFSLVSFVSFLSFIGHVFCSHSIFPYFSS